MRSDGVPSAVGRQSPVAWPAGMAVLIPVYNHAGKVGRVVAEVLALGAPVLVIDDGSTDGSGAAARGAGAEVVALDGNRGKATALRTGFETLARRGYRQALTADADGQHPSSQIAHLATAAREAEAIHVGVRTMRRAPWISRLGRLLSNTWSWCAAGVWMGDSQSGLRVYPLPAVVHLDAPADRFAYEIEILVRAVWARIPLRRCPVAVSYPADRVSHFHKLRDNLRAGGVLTRLCLRRLLPARRAR